MFGLLRRLSSDCWGNHEWISKANAHGMWLECRHCGLESEGMELPPARYVRTQEGADDAHRLGGMAPAQVARARASAVPARLRFGSRRTPSATPSTVAARSWDATAATSAVAATDAERRWLQAWRALTPEERAIAERLVAGLRLAPRVQTADDHVDQLAMPDRLVG
jgi:hypothetical protein